jgi:hypothetical protein
LRALEHRKRLFSFSNVLVCSDGSRRIEPVVDVPDGGDNECCGWVVIWPRVGDMANVFDINISLIVLYLYDTSTKYEAWPGIIKVVAYSHK